MKIYLNNEPLELPSENMTVSDLMTWKNISPQGTAIAVGDRLLRKDSWSTTKLADNMEVTVITAAFGG